MRTLTERFTLYRGGFPYNRCVFPFKQNKGLSWRSGLEGQDITCEKQHKRLYLIS